MGKKRVDYTVEDIVRLGGGWLIDIPSQMQALSCIYSAMTSFNVSPTDTKLLEVFGSGVDNQIIEDEGKIREIVAGCDLYELSTEVSNDLDCIELTSAKSNITRLLETINSKNRNIERREREIAYSLDQIRVCKEEIAYALDPKSKSLYDKVAKAHSISTFKYLDHNDNGNNAVVIRFIQSIPTVLVDVDIEANHKLEMDFGRYVCEMTINIKNMGITRLSVLAGYNTPMHGITIHPNVHGNSVCYGEGNSASGKFKADCNIAELLLLTDRMLRTMSTGTPYVSMETFCSSRNVVRVCGLNDTQRESLGLEKMEDVEIPSEKSKYAVIDGAKIKVQTFDNVPELIRVRDVYKSAKDIETIDYDPSKFKELSSFRVSNFVDVHGSIKVVTDIGAGYLYTVDAIPEEWDDERGMSLFYYDNVKTTFTSGELLEIIDCDNERVTEGLEELQKAVETAYSNR